MNKKKINKTIKESAVKTRFNFVSIQTCIYVKYLILKLMEEKLEI